MKLIKYVNIDSKIRMNWVLYGIVTFNNDPLFDIVIRNIKFFDKYGIEQHILYY